MEQSGQALYVNYSSSAANLQYIVSNGANFTYQNPEKFIEFPLTSTTAYTDNFVSTGTSGGYNIIRSGTVYGASKGYGTLITPYGTYTNVIKFEYIQDYKDSLTDFGFVIDYYAINTYWYRAGTGYPLISTHYYDFGGTISEYSSVLQSSTANVSEIESTQLSVHPNPAKDYIDLNLSPYTQYNSFSIWTMDGKMIREEQIISPQQRISTNELQEGTYFIQVKDANGEIGKSKFVKI